MFEYVYCRALGDPVGLSRLLLHQLLFLQHLNLFGARVNKNSKLTKDRDINKNGHLHLLNAHPSVVVVGMLPLVSQQGNLEEVKRVRLHGAQAVVQLSFALVKEVID